MAGLKCSWKGAGQQLKQNMNKAGQQVNQSLQQTAEDAANEIVRRGQADISGAGRFGSAWTQALQADVTATPGHLDVTVSMGGPPPVAYWKIFEYGATITAKNPSGMMWIPVDVDNKVWPRDYSGKLFRIGRGLFDAQTKEPKYFGTPQVNIPQKFHLRDIVFDVAKSMKQTYSAHMR